LFENYSKKKLNNRGGAFRGGLGGSGKIGGWKKSSKGKKVAERSGIWGSLKGGRKRGGQAVRED